MKSEITIALTGLFCTLVSSVVTFFLTKRKYNVEVDSQQIKNLNEAFETYKKMAHESLEAQKALMSSSVEHLNKVIEAQNVKIAGLEQENKSLQCQIENLKEQVIELMEENRNRKNKKK